jgi:large-conductance mechanosensitive channel
VTDDPFCSQCTEIPLSGTDFYLPLFLATALVGGLAATLSFSSEVHIITHTPLEEVVSHLLYGGFILSVGTFSIIAACSYTMQLVGRDLQLHWPIIWLPLATLMVTTITVVLAAQLWYINHHSHPGTASVTMAITFLVIALIPIFMEMDRLPHLPQTLREKKTEESQPA